MDCLNGYIGLKGCSTDIPDSGLYINSLPGISIESIDRIAGPEQVTYVKVWQDAQEEAAQRFSNDFFSELMKCYQVQPYCDYEGLICANKKILSGAWRYLLGNQLMIQRIYSTRINFFTTVAREDAEKLRDFYQVEYEKALNQAVLLIDTSSCCLECGGQVQYNIWAP